MNELEYQGRNSLKEPSPIEYYVRDRADIVAIKVRQYGSQSSYLVLRRNITPK
jgi:hypothetical protein